MSKSRRGLLLTTILTSSVVIGLAPAEAAAVLADASAEQSTAAPPADSGEVVVTATRQAQSASKVPITISAYDQAKLDAQDVRNVSDVARITPGLTFTGGQGANGNNNQISIRGVLSTIGAATTGIYIDDTPIQVRTLGNTATNTYPLIFDLQRVEVLKGPQGTLFGASSEGGAVRFITPKPDFDAYSVYARSELSQDDPGGLNYEAGVAVGGPIIDDKVAFRASVWDRHDGGWIDRSAPLTAADYGNLGGIPTTQKDINHQDSDAAKLDLAWRVTPNLTITPSVYFQDQWLADSSVAEYGVSDVSKFEYRTPNVLAQPTHDQYTLPAVLIEYNANGISYISNTSYFDRRMTSTGDYSYLSSFAWGSGLPYLTIPGQFSQSSFLNTQDVFTQEVRAQATTWRLNWVVGGFYSHAAQFQYQSIYEPYMNQEIQLASGGARTVASTYGSPLLANSVFFLTDIHSVDENLAGFAQGDFAISDQLKFTAGVRVSRTSFTANILRNGPLAGGLVTEDDTHTETPVTPKFGLTYQYDPNIMAYVSASEGFRPGGAQAPLSPIACARDLSAYGASSTPTQYQSDHLWSYEVGTKEKWLEGKLQFDASAFLVKWNNIQQQISFASCGGTFIANAGSATSAGGDLAIQLHPLRNLTLGATANYTSATFDQTTLSGATEILRTKGSPLEIPPFTLSLTGEYDRDVPAGFLKAPAGLTSYVSFDFQHTNRGPIPASTDYGYDPLYAPLPTVDQLNLRLGVRTPSGVDASLFVENATNDQPIQFNRNSAAFPYSSATAYIPRPRTIGVTATYRY